MKNFSLIGAALLSLALATPAMAAQHSYHYRNGRDFAGGRRNPFWVWLGSMWLSFGLWWPVWGRLLPRKRLR